MHNAREPAAVHEAWADHAVDGVRPALRAGARRRAEMEEA
jgi:hypothetical protein